MWYHIEIEKPLVKSPHNIHIESEMKGGAAFKHVYMHVLYRIQKCTIIVIKYKTQCCKNKGSDAEIELIIFQTFSVLTVSFILTVSKSMAINRKIDYFLIGKR